MKAMIFAAGLGTRLRPMTDTIPKALVCIGGKPMLERVIEKMIRADCREIVVNVHHFPEQIRDFLKEHHHFGITIHVSDESDAILDTGGGLLRAAALLRGDEPVLIHNVDVISNLDLQMLVNWHRASQALATLVVRERKTERYLLFNREMRLTGWTNRDTGETREALPEFIHDSKPLAFSGIHVVSPRFLDVLTGSGKFSLIDTYLRMTPFYPVMGYEDHSAVWMDVGKPAQLAEAERLAAAGEL